MSQQPLSILSNLCSVLMQKAIKRVIECCCIESVEDFDFEIRASRIGTCVRIRADVSMKQLTVCVCVT